MSVNVLFLKSKKLALPQSPICGRTARKGARCLRSLLLRLARNAMSISLSVWCINSCPPVLTGQSASPIQSRILTNTHY